MDQRLTLSQYLEWYAASDPARLAVAATIDALAGSSIEIAHLLSCGDAVEAAGEATGRNAAGDIQSDLDLLTHQRVRQALTRAPVVAWVSEEAPEPELLNLSGSVAVAVDPLDGSSNVDANTAVGTIFSVLPSLSDIGSTFRQPGTRQLAAGFTLYGPRTSLVLTVGEGVHVFTLDPGDRTFRLARRALTMPADSVEFAINLSNRRHWDQPVRAYIEDFLSPTEEPIGKGPNMRWHGALVAEAYRILSRGGIYLYPADARPGYGAGRLRLLYEAHPMALLFEQAGGGASTGLERILDLVATEPHQRVPLIMGSIENVRAAERLHLSPNVIADRRDPLFGQRGFFRA